MTSLWPAAAAKWRGVLPEKSDVLTRAAPCWPCRRWWVQATEPFYKKGLKEWDT